MFFAVITHYVSFVFSEGSFRLISQATKFLQIILLPPRQFNFKTYLGNACTPHHHDLSSGWVSSRWLALEIQILWKADTYVPRHPQCLLSWKMRKDRGDWPGMKRGRTSSWKSWCSEHSTPYISLDSPVWHGNPDLQHSGWEGPRDHGLSDWHEGARKLRGGHGPSGQLRHHHQLI